jgi:hypothetical protein
MIGGDVKIGNPKVRDRIDRGTKVLDIEVRIARQFSNNIFIGEGAGQQ